MYLVVSLISSMNLKPYPKSIENLVQFSFHTYYNILYLLLSSVTNNERLQIDSIALQWTQLIFNTYIHFQPNSLHLFLLTLDLIRYIHTQSPKLKSYTIRINLIAWHLQYPYSLCIDLNIKNLRSNDIQYQSVIHGFTKVSVNIDDEKCSPI